MAWLTQKHNEPRYISVTFISPFLQMVLAYLEKRNSKLLHFVCEHRLSITKLDKVVTISSLNFTNLEYDVAGINVEIRYYYEEKMLNNCQIWFVWHTDIWIIKDIFSIQFHKYKKRFPEAHNKYLIINQQLPNLSFRVCYCQSKSEGKHVYYMITCVFKKVFFVAFYITTWFNLSYSGKLEKHSNQCCFKYI